MNLTIPNYPRLGRLKVTARVRPCSRGILIWMVLVAAVGAGAAEPQPADVNALNACRAEVDALNAEYAKRIKSDPMLDRNKERICGSDPQAKDGNYQSGIGPIPRSVSIPICEGCAFSVDIFCLPVAYSGSLDGLKVIMAKQSVQTLATSLRLVPTAP